MAYQQRRPRPENAAPARRPPGPRPIEQLHPVLLQLILRMGVMPLGNPARLSEAQLANAVATAIGLVSEDEQTYLVSRFMSDEEIAQERLRSPEVQDLQRLVFITSEEKRILLRASPEPEEQGDDNAGGNDDNQPCLICSGRSALAVPCGCHYCLSCLRTCIRTGLRSEADFPPRCCRALDEATIRRADNPGLVHLYRQVATEYDVRADMRVYCHDPRCSMFIHPQSMDTNDWVGTCQACSKETCILCSGRAHRGLPCGEENDDEEMWDTMDANALVHCPSCGVVMGLSYGCNHMTCVCGYEFCFICGERWHTCNCPFYGEHHLRVPVRQRPGRRPVARAGRAHLAEQTEQAPRLPQLRYDENDAILLENEGDLLGDEFPEWEPSDEEQDDTPAYDGDVDDDRDAGLAPYPHAQRQPRRDLLLPGGPPRAVLCHGAPMALGLDPFRHIRGPPPGLAEIQRRVREIQLLGEPFGAGRRQPVPQEPERRRNNDVERRRGNEQARGRHNEADRRRRNEPEPMRVFGTEIRVVDGRLERRIYQAERRADGGRRHQNDDPFAGLLRYMAGAPNDRYRPRR